MADETRSHETSIEITATPEQVWQMISEAEGIAKWFAPEATTEPGVGGKFFISWGGGMDCNLVVAKWEPGEYLRLEDAVRPLIAVDYHIEAQAGGTTVLRLVHSFGTGPEWDNEFDGTKLGWPVFFRILKLAIERHWGKPGLSANLYEPMTGENKKATAWERLAGQTSVAWEVESSREAKGMDELVVIVPGWNEAMVWFSFTPKYVAASLATYDLAAERFEEVKGQVSAMMKAAVA